MAKKIIISIISIIGLYFVLKCSRLKFPDDFYYLKSYDGSKVMTIMNRAYLFETDSEREYDSGYFLFFGEISELDTLPLNYLKIKYSDSPIYVSWNDTIRLIYSEVLDNELNNSQIDFSPSYRDSDIQVIQEKVVMKDNFEMYFLDEIFRYEIDK
jgi:hypothetical protein